MRLRKSIVLLATLAFVTAIPAVQAASVSLIPAASTVPVTAGTATLELFMDFTGDPTVGGGIDLALSGPIAWGSFTPSAYLNTIPDPFFTDFGTAAADADFEIHFGDFAGLSGSNKLGDVTVNLLGAGVGTIAIAINSTFGGFFDINSLPQAVDLNGAQINVSAVPLPAAAWLLGSALGLLGGWRRLLRRSS